MQIKYQTCGFSGALNISPDKNNTINETIIHYNSPFIY